MAPDDTSPDVLANGGPPAAKEPVLAEPAPQEGYFGLTLRELIITGAWFLAFVVSFFPIAATPLGGGVAVWGMDGQWMLTIGVPTVAVFLLVLRRFSPEGIRRVGSLAIDQFASVAFSVGAVSWAVMLWQQVHLATATGGSPLSTWVTWVETVLMSALVVLTVFAPLVPGIKEDFAGRTESLAHRNANPVRPVVARPKPAPPAAVPVDGAEADSRSDRVELDGLIHADSAPSRSLADRPAPAGTAGVRRGTGTGDEDPIDPDEADAPATPYSSYSAFAHAAGGAFGTAVVADGTDARPRYARRGVPEGALPDADGSSPTVDGRESRPHRGDGRHDEVDPDAVTAVFGAGEDGRASATVGEQEDDVETRAHRTFEEGDVAQPFWALAPERRPVHDEHGVPIFEIGPEEWILVLEDRGGAFVVRHEDGRVGFLHDTTDMTRG